MTKRNVINIGFLAFNEMQALDLFGPLEVFQEANEQRATGKIYKTFVITSNGRPVSTSSGVRVSAHVSLDDCPRLHTLIVAGGAGARSRRFPSSTIEWIRNEAPKLTRLGSICTGLFILARTGLLKNRRVSTHWHHADEAQHAFPNLLVERDALYIRDGKYFTAAGVTAGIDLALALIAEDHGPRFSSQIARHLVVFFNRPGDQRQFSSTLRQQGNSTDQFADLIAWIPDNLQTKLTSAVLAERVNLSERQFRRRFSRLFSETPTRYIERVRAETAGNWLLTDGLTVDRVAQLCGYQSADTFRRAFERQFGVTPSEYRSRFSERSS